MLATSPFDYFALQTRSLCQLHCIAIMSMFIIVLINENSPRHGTPPRVPPHLETAENGR
jgi:hypothetical protein